MGRAVACVTAEVDFALIGHPENWQAAADILTVLRGLQHSRLPDDEVRDILPWIPPRPVCHVDVGSVTGTGAHGIYIDAFIPPDHLEACYTHDNLARVRAAAVCAIKVGAKIVSLGGFSSILMEGNFNSLPEIPSTVFTTGNTLTVGFIVQGIRKMCTVQSRSLRKSTLLIVGATGDVGSGCVRCLAPEVGRVLLHARNVERLRRLAAELQADGVEVEIATDLGQFSVAPDIVICAASLASPSLLLRIAPNALICDAGYPKNLSPTAAMPDATIFFGGLGQIAGGLKFAPDFRGILNRHPFPDIVHGCLLEGMALALEGRYEAFSQGRGFITPHRVAEMLRIAARHGISLAPLYNAAGPLRLPLLDSQVLYSQVMPDDFSRRNFMKTTAAAAITAPGILRAQNASGAVRVGWIGVGSRGYYLMERLYTGSKDLAQVTAVCDTYTQHLTRAKDRVQTMGGNSPKTYEDFQDLLQDPSIDAVVISTPEHLHFPMFMAALKAGKNIYVEKPLAHTIEEGEQMVQAAEQSGKVIQVGTQNRSNSLYQQAKEMVAQGMIGDVHYVRAFWYRNSLDDNPAWRYKVPDDASPQNSDWSKFLGGAPKHDWDPHRYFQWRLYWDYSGGIATDLLVHQTDITNFVCGKTVPASCMASGGIYRWTANDDRDTPDTFSAIYEYGDKFHINYSSYFGNDHYGYGENFMGNEGTIEVLNRQFLNFYPEKFGGKAPASVSARKELHVELPGNDNKAVEAHIKNWLEAIQGKAKVIAPTRIGQEAAISGHLATLSFRNNKKVLWDEQARKYHFA